GDRLCRRRVQLDRHLPRLPAGRVGAADRLRGRRRRAGHRQARGDHGGRVGRGAARHADPRAARLRRPDARDPLDLRGPGLPRCRPRARLARRDRAGQLPGHHRHPGHGRLLAAVPDRGDHPRPGRGAPGRQGTRPGCAAAGQPVRAGRQGRHDRLALVRAPERRGPRRGGQPMTGVATAFTRANGEGRAVLVGYLPAGFPTVDGAIAAARAMAASGADVIEIGLPYTDPLLDGPVIQTAVDRALASGTRVTDVLRTVEAVAATGVPVLVMTYWNPVDHYGVARFARDLAAAGGSGLITPDLTPEE